MRIGLGIAAHEQARPWLIAVSPDPDRTLPYLLRLPLAGGMAFRTSGTWPASRRCTAARWTPEWPEHSGIVERTQLRSCGPRGTAIDLGVGRSREPAAAGVHRCH
jgi:hypothetical protein